ncbi:MAG: SGNH/GDSL hydrolase family protein [Pseudonocardia sp.]|nr:SGNH/GDSL hydrolase family protein [Pseudonocardia sp.]MBO0876370.1 SGNH/GDSL hydrolase family protein [Pseudonocardia sp.]
MRSPLVRRVARAVITVVLCVGFAVLVPGVSAASTRTGKPSPTPSPSPSPSPEPGPGSGEYVALGDSYTAGPRIPEQNGQPPGCQRSDHDYPSLVNAELRVSSFRDVSCTGAKTTDMAWSQLTNNGLNPPQLDALSRNTTLVTLGVGGNDIDFTEIVTTCAIKSPREPNGAACRAFYTQGGRDQLADRIARTAPNVAQVLGEIRRRAPGARILVVGYPTILPDSGPGCFPVVPFSPGDVAYLRQTTMGLNGMLIDQAKRANVEFVDTYRSSIGHDICQNTGVRWVEHLVPTSPAAPMHPNELGMRNDANQVLAVLGGAAPAGS